eukprot:g5435.t1
MSEILTNILTQGVLYLFSAIVVVVGYVYQAHVDKVTAERNLRMKRVREKLSTFVAPMMQHYVASGNFMFSYWTKLYGEKEGMWNVMYDKLMARDGGFDGWIKGKSNLGYGLVLENEAKLILSSPDSKLAVEYRMVVTILIKQYLAPMRELIILEAADKAELPSEEDFKKDFPGAKDFLVLRHLFFCQMRHFVDEFEWIIDKRWEKGDYTIIHPEINKWPYQIGRYLSKMMSQLREEEDLITNAAVHTESISFRRDTERFNEQKKRRTSYFDHEREHSSNEKVSQEFEKEHKSLSEAAKRIV